MGFIVYFFQKHPILNFVFQDPDDPVKGFRRRTITLTVLFITFSFTMLNDHVFYDGWDTERDFDHLRETKKFSDHLGLTIAFSGFMMIAEWLLEAYYKLPDRWCCSWPCCMPFRYAVYYNVVWVFLVYLIVYVAVLRNYPNVFLGMLQLLCDVVLHSDLGSCSLLQAGYGPTEYTRW